MVEQKNKQNNTGRAVTVTFMTKLNKKEKNMEETVKEWKKTKKI